MNKHIRPRCFLDISINGAPQGRITVELYDDVVPQTCSNFLQLCEGLTRLGRETGKPLSYRGSLFHRVIDGFMIQGGDFSHNNGTGGESVFGGVFDDENFDIKHDQPLTLSMANCGKNTNGSQFFITTAPTPELDELHVAFGRVIYGRNIIEALQQVPVDAGNRPLVDVVITECGRLVPKEDKGKAKEDRATPEVIAKQTSNELKKEETVVSSIRPEDLPEVPSTGNFLLRRVPDTNVAKTHSKQYTSRKQERYSHSGTKVKGRGTIRYRANSTSRSPPPHWRNEERRLIPMKTAHGIIARHRKEAEKSATEVTEQAVKEKSASPNSEEEDLASVRGLPMRKSDVAVLKKRSTGYVNPVADFVKVAVKEMSPKKTDKENSKKQAEKRLHSRSPRPGSSKRRKSSSSSSGSSTSSEDSRNHSNFPDRRDVRFNDKLADRSPVRGPSPFQPIDDPYRAIHRGRRCTPEPNSIKLPGTRNPRQSDVTERARVVTPEKTRVVTPEKTRVVTPEKTRVVTPERSRGRTPERTRDRNAERTRDRNADRRRNHSPDRRRGRSPDRRRGRSRSRSRDRSVDRRRGRSRDRSSGRSRGHHRDVRRGRRSPSSETSPDRRHRRNTKGHRRQSSDSPPRRRRGSSNSS